MIELGVGGRGGGEGESSSVRSGSRSRNGEEPRRARSCGRYGVRRVSSTSKTFTSRTGI